ncbi:MAG: hypothetical protein Q8N51_18640 [Gammaproteobacteria bacterium]|nr:hypothetical protein [Gammaproteobacteria bacterium]
MRRHELEEKLHAGDLSVQRALEIIDRAISGRTLKVQHSRQRLEAAKEAVAAGMDKDEARRINSKAVAKRLVAIRAKQKTERR